MGACGLYQTPFANAPGADNKDSYGITFYRTRILDRIPLKIISGLIWRCLHGKRKINADAVVYWYALQNAVITARG